MTTSPTPDGPTVGRQVRIRGGVVGTVVAQLAPDTWTVRIVARRGQTVDIGYRNIEIEDVEPERPALPADTARRVAAISSYLDATRGTKAVTR